MHTQLQCHATDHMPPCCAACCVAGALCALGAPAWQSDGSARLGSRLLERSRSGSGGYLLRLLVLDWVVELG